MEIPFLLVLRLAFIALIFVVTTLGVWAAQRERSGFDAGGNLIMRYVLPIRVASIVLGLIPTVMLGAFLYFGIGQGPSNFLGLLAVFSILFLLGVTTFFEFSFAKVIVSKDGIVEKSPCRNLRAVAWKDIVEVYTLNDTYPFVFKSRDGRKFRIFAGMTGIREMVQIFQKHLDQEVYAKSWNKIIWYTSS